VSGGTLDNCPPAVQSPGPMSGALFLTDATGLYLNQDCSNLYLL
jgi:hypothetical protein